MEEKSLAVLGAGNIGLAIANGLVESGLFAAERVTLTRRKVHLLSDMAARGFVVEQDNARAVAAADLVIVAVEPRQIDGLLEQIGPRLEPERHTLISVVSGVEIEQIHRRLPAPVPVIRAMPNTAIALGESMTCLATDGRSESSLTIACQLFDAVGRTLVIDEEQMSSATALGACGVAFFLRAIRAASQGGIEIGFHAEDALLIAAQTARGAASLLLSRGAHPEREIDRVTTPRGCTIAGLNRMEHEGFSSALIRGIITSAEKAGGLYPKRG